MDGEGRALWSPDALHQIVNIGNIVPYIYSIIHIISTLDFSEKKKSRKIPKSQIR